MKILVLGNDLPIFCPGLKVEAAHYRTWQFVEPLIRDGHTILLVAEEVDDLPGAPVLPQTWSSQLTYHSLSYKRRGWIGELQKLHDDFVPDCIVAVNFYSCLYATRLRTAKPIWMDIYGDMLTILQAVGYRRQNNAGQITTRRYLESILRVGDVFSACGVPQQHILVGELGMVGRLNWQSFAYSYSRVILPGAAPLTVSRLAPRQRQRMAGLGIEPEAFIVLWAGGYNTWTDVQTLCRALEWAMQQNHHIYFVSLGASTYDAPDNTYACFLELIERSPNREHFRMLGWRPWQEIPTYYVESDVGLNIDALHYETIYGTRTRLVEMIAAGLPVITSLGCDLSYQLCAQGIGLGFDIGDWQLLGKHILTLSQTRPLWEAISQKAMQAACNEWSFAETTRPLRDWVRAPRLAPDKLAPDAGPRQARLVARAAVRQLLWRLLGNR